MNGRVVAQRTGLTPMYFQYDKNGTPFGFIYQDKQYFYITNLSGDVVGITDADGNKIASYTYDAWGKLLDITATDMSLAKLNPLRYRGYYYDNETGYYYLQSRYYDPEIGRFISADSFEYIDDCGKYTTNAYIYCLNSPLSYIDNDGYLATEIAAGSVFALFLEEIIAALCEMLTYVLVGVAVGSIVAGLYIVGVVISAVISSITNNGKTEVECSDTSAKRRNNNNKEYTFCYMNKNGNKKSIGKKMNWTSTMAALGVTNTTLDFNVTRNINSNGFNNDAKSAMGANGNCWGIYADSQEAAKTLAMALGCNESPKYVSGGYAHYHDRRHNIHIWYGNKIK